MAMGVDIQEEQTDRYALGEFGDLRLKNRALLHARRVSRQEVCLRPLGGYREGEIRFGRFLANPRVTAKELILHGRPRNISA
jgi:hypothetical protein